MGAGRKQVVIIEDNDGDARIIEEALATLAFDCDILRFRDGREALPALLKEDAPVPDIVLLDLYMPGSDGLDILRQIRNTPRLTFTMVGILTGSQEANDQLRASVIGATRYIHKPKSYADYVRNVCEAVEEMLARPRTAP